MYKKQRNILQMLYLPIQARVEWLKTIGWVQIKKVVCLKSDVTTVLQYNYQGFYFGGGAFFVDDFLKMLFFEIQSIRKFLSVLFCEGGIFSAHALTLVGTKRNNVVNIALNECC